MTFFVALSLQLLYIYHRPVHEESKQKSVYQGVDVVYVHKHDPQDERREQRRDWRQHRACLFFPPFIYFNTNVLFRVARSPKVMVPCSSKIEVKIFENKKRTWVGKTRNTHQNWLHQQKKMACAGAQTLLCPFFCVLHLHPAKEWAWVGKINKRNTHQNWQPKKLSLCRRRPCCVLFWLCLAPTDRVGKVLIFRIKRKNYS